MAFTMAKALLRLLPPALAGRYLGRRLFSLTDQESGRPTLLALNRTVMSSDLRALNGRAALNVMAVWSSDFRAMLRQRVPKREQSQTYFAGIYASYSEARRESLRRVARAALDGLLARTPIDAIVVANTDYWEDVVMMDVARERGIPFLVLCRENYAVQETQDWLRNHIAKSGYAFHGDGVAVASDITKTFFEDVGCYGNSVIETVGWPRFDSWRDPNPYPPAERNLVTLVSYHDPLYLAPQNYKETLETVAAAAKASADPARYVVKLKEEGHRAEILAICPELAASGATITAATPMDDLLRRSRMVIGYNTTGILEGYLGDAAIVVPWWKDAVRPAVDTLISHETPEDRATTHFPTSPDELRSLMEQAFAGPLPPLGDRSVRLSRFHRFVAFDADVSAAQKFEAFVRRFL